MCVNQDNTESKILIGFGESLSAPEVAWSLLDSGYRVAVLARHGSRFMLRRCNEIELIWITAPELDVQQSVDDIIDYLNKEQIAAMMPLDDASIWLYDQINGISGLQVLGPTGKQAKLAVDKRLQIEAAKNSGISVPDSQVLYGSKDANSLERFPLILKPAMAIENSHGKLRKGRIYLCADQNELECSIERWNGDYALLAQPLHHGTGEGIFGIATDGGVCAWSAHRRVRMMNPEGSGSSACVSIAVERPLQDLVENLVMQARWRGMFMVEFLREDTGKLLFMEINGRPWGSMALSRRVGYEYPAWVANMFLGSNFSLPQIDSERTVLCRHLGREILHVLKVLRGPKSKAIRKWPSRWKAILDVLRVSRYECWYNWRKGKLKLFLYDIYCTVFSSIFGKGKF